MVKAFELSVFSPGDMVVTKGEVGSEMFFIVKGVVDILIEDGAHQRRASMKVAEKRMGDYFGEVALVLDNQVRTAWVCAHTFCVLAQLTRSAFEECMRGAPEVRQAMVHRIRLAEHQIQQVQQVPGCAAPISERSRQASKV